ncbi:MAG: MipA/OmpV family protein [Gemmatimonadota bacterium]
MSSSIPRFLSSVLVLDSRWAAAIAVAFALAPAPAVAADSQRNWDFDVGVGVAVAPDYEGASATSARLRIWADGAYHTTGYGSFALDSGSLTIAPEARWDIVDRSDMGAGMLVGYRSGRSDRSPGFTSVSDGSARLRGLPDVSDAVDAGVAGHVTVLGVPWFAQLRAALGSSQGSIGILGVYLPLEPTPGLELTFLPTVTWANARQMRAFFGVSPEAAQASGFEPYDPGGGWQSAAIEIAADWHIAGGWHLVGSVAYERLLGDAAGSPIVQTPNQPSALAGVTLAF